MTDRKFKAGAENEMKPEDLRNGWVMRSSCTGEGIYILVMVEFLVLIQRRP